MCLLILGGTSEAKKIASQLHQHNVPVIYSVAGLVRSPDLDCQIVSGGFTQFGGLVEFIKANAVAAILDMTHPFAEQISAKANTAAKKCDIAYWRYQRPQWQKQQGDDWTLFDSWQELLPALDNKRSLFISSGQIQEQHLVSLTNNVDQTQVLRTAIAPAYELPESVTWIQAIGPFDVAAEVTLLKKYSIDAIVSKMSGGTATEAKLTAARTLGIPVYLLARPRLDTADKEFSELQHCLAFVLDQFRCN